MAVRNCRFRSFEHSVSGDLTHFTLNKPINNTQVKYQLNCKLSDHNINFTVVYKPQIMEDPTKHN